MLRTNKRVPENRQRALRHCVTCTGPCGCVVLASLAQGPGGIALKAARQADVAWGPSRRRERRGEERFE